MTSPAAASHELDLRIIFEIPVRQFIPWLVTVLLVLWVGYPGVICVTPMAWLMALRVGNICAARSRTESSSRRLTEAAFAGGVFGLLQGLLFGIVVPWMGPIESNERGKTIILILIMIIVGIFVAAGLSFFTACLNERRRNQAMQ